MGRIKVVAIASLLPLVMAGCSDDGTDGGAEPQPDETAEATVAVEDSDLGQIVVDAEGKTLYVFLVDEGSDSTCYDDCEAAWPPFTVEGDPAAGEGIDASLVGTTERNDGSTQVTLDGHPLYYFGSDETADDINGQGVGDVWFVVSPEGEAIQS